MKFLLLLIYFFYVGSSLFPIKRASAIIPFYFLPNSSNLERESIEIAKSAYQLLLYGQKEDSLQLAKLAISLNDKDENIWAILAEAQIANQLYEEALLSIEEGKKINPNMSEFYFAESSIFLDQNNLGLAKESLTLGLQIDPNNHRGIFQLGNIYLIEKNFKKALIEFEKAIILKPDFWQAINNRGLVFYELDKKLLAISSFEEAISIEEDAETILALAVSLQSNNKLEAIALAQRALTLNPQYVSYEYRKEQLWGEKLQSATEKLFSLDELEEVILYAKEYIN
tara:strand:+ start:656 stop:1507 length:852 start_codon:yes stop_codon:yes gene_type:complete